MQKVDVDEETLAIVAEEDWSVPDETTVNLVVKAIEDLKDPYGIVVKLFLLEGYDHQEISEVLSISENASRTYLHRGKKQLKEQLKHVRDGTGY
jgi:RNA polymerase sigma-70 factor (ECF subfamily)